MNLGTYEVIKNVKSDFFNNKRDIIVYLPPGYEENYLKYYKNVIIMTDG